MRHTIILMVTMNVLPALMFLTKTTPTEETVMVPVEPKFALMMWRIAAGFLLVNAVCFIAALPSLP